MDEGDAGWKPLLEELARRRAEARAQGGEERVAARRAAGRGSARERVGALLDPGSFAELGTLVGGSPDPGEPPRPADAFVAGAGRIEGRPVLVGAEDFTVAGGSIGLEGADKRFRLTQLAAQERVPLVFLLEGAGHRMTNALRGHGRRPNDLQGLAELSGVVPTVCVVLGPSAGHGALAAPLMDFVVMAEGAALFSAGPPLVRDATGEEVDKETLGGTAVHVRGSGVAHNAAPDEAAALALARRYLGYFPSNAWERPPQVEGPDTGPRRLEGVLSLVPPDPRRPYPIRPLIEMLCDAGSVLEVQPEHGEALRTVLARLGGRAVAVLANDPSVRAGALDRAAAEKGARFLETVGAFHLPVVFLADNPGVMAGPRAEREGALRAAARLFAAQHRLRVPKLSVTLRKAFGFGSSVMAMNPFDGQTLALAWPGVSLGAMPAAGGARASRADDATRAALDASEAGGPWRIAHGMGFDEIVDPRELRDVLREGLALAARRPAPAGPIARVGTLP